MTPSLKKVGDTFEKIATQKGINLQHVNEDWLVMIIQATQICDFKTEEIFIHYIETALNNIQKQN